jgi:biopolymer transport protein ExbB/TolQ
LGYLGWIWLSLIAAAIYGSVVVALLLYRSGSRLARAGKSANSIFLQLQNLPEQELAKSMANTPVELAGLVKSRSKQVRARRNEKAARRRAQVARLDTLMSEQVRRKK